jgi:hypothetical protein
MLYLVRGAREARVYNDFMVRQVDCGGDARQGGGSRRVNLHARTFYWEKTEVTKAIDTNTHAGDTADTA